MRRRRRRRGGVVEVGTVIFITKITAVHFYLLGP